MKFLKKQTILIIALALSFSGFTQVKKGTVAVKKTGLVSQQNIELINQIGGEGKEKGYSIVTDNSDFYTVGVFSKKFTVNTLALDEDDEYTIKKTLTLEPIGKKDGLVSKYSKEGELLWVTQLSATSYLNANVIDVNEVGGIYVAGTFKGDFTFTVEGTKRTISSKGQDGDAFILQINSKGKIEWVRQFGGIESTLHFTGLKIGKGNSIFLSGNFSGKTNFNTSKNWAEKQPEFLTSGGGEVSVNNGFILKLNYVADFVWVKQIASDFDTYTTSIEVDIEDNIYLAGNFQEKAKFFGNNEISAVASQDSYLVKINESGEIIWHKTFGSIGDEKITSITLNKENKLIVCGNFKTEIDGEEVSDDNDFLGMKSNGSVDGFVLSLNLDGEIEWKKQIKNDLDIYLQSITNYENNDVLVVAYIKNEFNRFMYIAKLSGNGDMLSETILKGSYIHANGVAINKDAFNDVFIIGHFKEKMKNGTSEYTSKGRTDIFVLKLK